MMDRRPFLLTLLAGAVAAPFAVEAQETKLSRIGVLTGASEPSTLPFEAFREGLREHGYREGQNIALEFRFARGRLDVFPALAAELVRLKVDVIVTDGGNAAPLAAKKATQTIPIVMAVSGDPVKAGLIASFGRPGANVTGLTLLAPDLLGKRLELLRTAVPQAVRVAVLWNSSNTRDYLEGSEAAARILGVKIQPVDVKSADHLEVAFQAVARDRSDALVTVPDVMLWNSRTRIVEFANRNRLPAIFPEREFAEAGGLLAYGPSVAANFRRAAAFVDKILKGAKPAELPVERPSKLELIVNLKTAKSLGMMLPRSVLLQADHVIE